MILCGPAEEDNFSFEDLVEAEFDVVQRMAEHYRKPGPATVQSFRDMYRLIYVAPFTSCIKAAALWALDSGTEVLISMGINYDNKPKLSEDACQRLCEEYCLNARFDYSGGFQQHSRVMFMPEELQGLCSAENLFQLINKTLEMVKNAQRTTEEAVWQAIEEQEANRRLERE